MQGRALQGRHGPNFGIYRAKTPTLPGEVRGELLHRLGRRHSRGPLRKEIGCRDPIASGFSMGRLSPSEPEGIEPGSLCRDLAGEFGHALSTVGDLAVDLLDEGQEVTASEEASGPVLSCEPKATEESKVLGVVRGGDKPEADRMQRHGPHSYRSDHDPSPGVNQRVQARSRARPLEVA